MMIGVLIFTIIMTLLQVLRVSLYILRKDISLFKKIIELVILMGMILLEYFNLVVGFNKYYIIISGVLSLYVLVLFVYDILIKNNYVSVLSVKNGIDLADAGILFLDSNGDIVLINNLFYGILKNLNINNNYVDNLIKYCFDRLGNDYLLRYEDNIYLLKNYGDCEISLINITKLYFLQEEEKKQNKLIKVNNNKLLLAVKNMEEIEKEKNLLKLKNEYHDIIGYRLALFNNYLKDDSLDINNALFLLDSIYEDFNSNLNSSEKLNNLIGMYRIIGINIGFSGLLPLNEGVASVFFEIIREGITNAIIHADSKNIDIVITSNNDYIEMTIKNDGKRADKIIYENEGIKGIRRKLSSVNGSLKILNDDVFTLIIRV